MSYLGDFAEDATVRIPLTTHAKTGGAIAPSSAFEAADFRIYKNGSATEKATTNGVTITSPFDSVTGLHVLEVDTANNTGDDGFWTTAADYWVVLSPDETVDSETVVAVVATFSIQNRYMRGTDNALLASSYTAPANSDITAIKAKTDNLPATPASSTDVQTLAVPVISPTIERVNGDTDAIRFTWPVDSATITGEVSKNGGSYAAVVGAITQRTTEAGVYWYQLAYNAGDRTLGSVRYKFTDGTRTRFVNLLVNPASAEVDLDPVLDKLPESGRASTLTAQQVWEYASRTLTTIGDSSGITTLLSRITGLIRTSADDVSAETAQTSTIRSGLALEATLDAAETAILSAIDGIEGGGSGLTGANSILITVRDALTNAAIEGAKVRFFRTGEDGTQATNASGQTTFTIESATWSYTVKATGYIGSSGSQTFSANGILNVSLTAQTFPTSPDPDLCDLSFVVASQSGEDLSGIVCDAKFAQGFAVTTGRLYINAIETATSDSEGAVTLRLVQGATYDITATRAGHRKTVVRVTVPALTSAQLTTAIVI